MSIASQISRIQQNVSDSLIEVANKGVLVPAGSTSDDLPELIAQITSGAGSAITVTDTLDENGGTIRTITAVSLEGDTVSPSTLLQGYTAHNSLGEAIVGTLDPGSSPTGTINITANGQHDVSAYATANVQVPTGGATLQEKTHITPSESSQTITPDANYDGLSSVQIDGISSTYVGSGIDRNDSADLSASGATVSVPAGYYAEAASKAVATASHPKPSLSLASATGIVTASHTQSAGYVSSGTTTDTLTLSTQAATTITPTKSQQTAVAAGKYTTGAVTVAAIPSEYIIPTGTKTITENGTGIDVSAYASVDVSVSSEEVSLQAKTHIAPTESSQTVTADSGYDGLSSVQIDAISSTYVGSDIAQNDSDDLTASGATVTVPAGYYSEQASKSVATGTVTAPTSISGTTAAVSTGSNTLTLTKTVSVTPRVTTAGYVSSGTAGNASVTLTANVTTKAAATITPTKSAQTIASGTYLTGTQTIAAIPDAYQDVTGVTAAAGDVVSGKSIVDASGNTVNGSLVIQHYYTGTGAPSASLGENGDIYLQTT